jgi:endonuclease VIII
VWLTAHRLHRAQAGHVLIGCDLRVPQLATADLTGRRVLEVASRGKHLLTRLSGGLTLHSHLRMDGSWHLYRHGTQWAGGPPWQIRALLTTERWVAVGYRLPVLELLNTAEENTVVGHLGPDLLGADWNVAEAIRRLRLRPGCELGPALLDQRNLAGIGNLYKAEVCFLSGVSPWMPVGEVERLTELVRRAQRLLRANRDRGVQVTTGDTRRGFHHWVFERSGQPCRRCGTAVASAHQGAEPRARITYWCPSCQPGISPYK